MPRQNELHNKMKAHCIEFDEPLPCPRIGIRWSKDLAHLALYTGSTIIHAYEKRKQVIEHGFRGKWLERVAGVWLLPGVHYE